AARPALERRRTLRRGARADAVVVPEALLELCAPVQRAGDVARAAARPRPDRAARRVAETAAQGSRVGSGARARDRPVRIWDARRAGVGHVWGQAPDMSRARDRCSRAPGSAAEAISSRYMAGVRPQTWLVGTLWTAPAVAASRARLPASSSTASARR